MLRKIVDSDCICSRWDQIGRDYHLVSECVSLASPVVVYNRRGTRLAAHPIGILSAYADLAEFQPRRGSGEACFASYRFIPKVSTVAPFLLDCSGRSCDRRKPEAQARQRRTPFGAKETQPC